MATTSGESVSSFSQAGGIMETTAVTRSSPSSSTRVCKVWSSRQLSDWPLGRMIEAFLASAIAASERRFLRSVLSSPLCAISRKGWAMEGCGSVLVENRVWKYMVWTVWSGSTRSRK
ncbi:hypothetical protein D3C72_1599410 [compost metagenome]